MVWHIIRANILLIVNVIHTDRIRMSLNTLTKNRSQLPDNFFCSGIINLLFDGLAYNLLIARIFPRSCGARKNTTQLGK